MTVMIPDCFEYYRLAAYLAFRTKERIGIVMGVPSLLELFDEKYYTQLPGGASKVLDASGFVLPHHISPLSLTSDSPAYHRLLLSAFVRSHLHKGRKWRQGVA